MPSFPFALAVYRLEMLLKRLITPKSFDRRNGKIVHYDVYGQRMRKSFICDSHPCICIVCGHIRTFLRLQKCPKRLAIQTKTGPYLWVRDQVRTYSIKGAANFTPLYGRHKTEYQTEQLKPNLFVFELRHFYFSKDPIPPGATLRLSITIPRDVK